MGNNLTKCCSEDRRHKKQGTLPTTSLSDPTKNSSAQACHIPLNSTTSPSNTYAHQNFTSLLDADSHHLNTIPKINNQDLNEKSIGTIPPLSNLVQNSNTKILQSSSDKSRSTTATTILSGQLQSLSLAQGLDNSSIKLTEEERKVLLANEIPASEIEDLSIGVDSGGMGVIHVAKWKGIKVAIKEASENVISKEVEIYSLMKGAEGVVQFYGVTYPPGLNKLCIVTKYAENGSLSWYLKVSFHKLTWAEKIMLATQITSSITRLHQNGIFHRDLHGGNILIDEEGNAMLTDFGASTVDERVVKSMDEYAIASLTTTEGKSKFVSGLIPDINENSQVEASARKEPSSNLSTVVMDGLNPSDSESNNNGQSAENPRRQALIGVMAYIAPERFRNPGHFDARCDVYSLGVLLWELTSGHAAFAKIPQDVQLAVSILNGKRETSIEGTPVMYQELYGRCWETDPEMRPSLDEISSTLARIHENLSEEQLAMTQERNVVHSDDETDFEESMSLPRPTSDFQECLLED
ncbi:hypothetical protein BGX27_008877 [Mortierella sp. AM989]|nr:hypothetical protein BGX27_008877 [Mortierella sp. AM989]